MNKERLEEIRAGVEGLDTGRYHGADMVADALVEKNSEARELLDEIDGLTAFKERVHAALALRLEQKPVLEEELQKAIDSDRRIAEAGLREFLEWLDLEIPLLQSLVD